MIEKLEHVLMVVNDFSGTVNFYKKAFGFKILRKWKYSDAKMGAESEIAYLYRDNGDIIEVLEAPEPKPVPEYDETNWQQWMVNSLGVKQICFTVNNFDKVIERLTKFGAKLIVPPFARFPEHYILEVKGKPKDERLKRVIMPSSKGYKIAMVADINGLLIEIIER